MSNSKKAFFKKSLLYGVGSSIDIGSTMANLYFKNYFNLDTSSFGKDALSIYNDWKTIGNDMRIAIDKIK
ncbi:MAG: hypothetical protein KAT05_17085 [Spirochaetes bacterium]|nr:hypothetical protein [Spirochaetota bacterium]